MKEEIEKLKDELERLKVENERLRSQRTQQESQTAYGFSLQHKGNYWHAVKRIAGKLHWVYIGKSPEGAREKIEAYLKENNLLDFLPNKLGKIGTNGMADLKTLLEKMGGELKTLGRQTTQQMEWLKEIYPSQSKTLQAELAQIQKTLGTMASKHQEVSELVNKTSQEAEQSKFLPNS